MNIRQKLSSLDCQRVNVAQDVVDTATVIAASRNVREDTLVLQQVEVGDHLRQMLWQPGVLIAKRVSEGPCLEDFDTADHRGPVLLMFDRMTLERLFGSVVCREINLLVRDGSRHESDHASQTGTAASINTKNFAFPPEGAALHG